MSNEANINVVSGKARYRVCPHSRTGVVYEDFWSRVKDNTWEPETRGMIDRVLSKDWTFVDIGAWIGPTTLQAAAGSRARVYAFEPDPVAFSMLRDNVALNAEFRDRITLYETAIGLKDGTLKLFSAAFGNSESSLVSEVERLGNRALFENSITVNVKSIDKVFSEIKAPKGRTLVKIDVEGAEYSLLDYIKKLVSDYGYIVYISTHPQNLVGDTEIKTYMRRVEGALMFSKLFVDHYIYYFSDGDFVNVQTSDHVRRLLNNPLIADELIIAPHKLA